MPSCGPVAQLQFCLNISRQIFLVWMVFFYFISGIPKITIGFAKQLTFSWSALVKICVRSAAPAKGGDNESSSLFSSLVVAVEKAIRKWALMCMAVFGKLFIFWSGLLCCLGNILLSTSLWIAPGKRCLQHVCRNSALLILDLWTSRRWRYSNVVLKSFIVPLAS